MSKQPKAGMRPETRAILAGRDAAGLNAGAVNPPIHRGSTVVIDRVADLYGAGRTYGLSGQPIHAALREALLDDRPAADVQLTPSGLAACTLALLAVANAGDDILLVDSAYGPTRRFCENTLKRLGVSHRSYAPGIGADIAQLIQPNTRAIVLEAPGSLTFEMQDVPAIAAAARAAGVITIIDDTWSAGVFFEPFAHGIDLSIQALTKYQAGHADVLMGAIFSRTPELARQVEATSRDLGIGPGGSEDAYLVLRGLRTMRLRLTAQDAAGRALARWLETRPEVSRVLHPALESHPDHAIWARDFSGAAGVFGAVLKPCPQAGLTAMLEGLDVFSMGFSWGGYESLVIPCDAQVRRAATPWSAEGPLLRFSAGLEHIDDLIADLEAGLARLAHGGR